MDMCINRLLLKLLILISFVPKNYGGIVSFGPAEGTVVALNSILKLTCEISGFTNGTNAVLKRNGTTINSCTNVDFCNVGPTYNISNAVFTFRGEANRVILTINPLLVGEVGLDYECNYNSVPEVYTIKLSTTTSLPTTTPTTTTTTPISSTPPSTSLQKCIGFIELESCRTLIIGFIVFGIVVVFLLIGGVIYWKRNQKKTSLQKKKHSDRGTRSHENTRGAQELQNQ